MTSNTTFHIKLNSNITAISFEELLKKNYYKSKLKTNSIVIFDFTYVSFCGLLELSQIALWIFDLSERPHKKIGFVPPKNKEFLVFLYNYEFINFLINIELITEDYKSKKPYTPFSAPMFPMKFQNDSEFQDFLNDLNTPGRLELILGDIKDNELIKNNVIHSIILKEIGDNIFIHSGSSLSNIIMTRFKRLSPFNCTEFERPFLNKIGNCQIVNIVISDYGKGLYKNLISSYNNDIIIPKKDKSDNPSEIEVIKYAFLKHSTSRSDEERKRDLIKNINSESLKLPLPTGLHKVKNITKQYRGLLYVRSGKSIVCYDYFSESGKERIFTNKSDKKLSSLSSFPGTQFKIYFPILEQVKQNQPFYIEDKSNITFEKNIFLNFISLNDYIDVPFNECNEDNVSKLQLLLDNIESIKLEKKGACGAVIFDVANFSKITNKNIKHVIISSIMSAQTQDVSFILVNISKEVIYELYDDYLDDSFSKFYLPLLAYDSTFVPYIIGLSNPHFHIISNHYETLSNDEKKTFIKNSSHIFHGDDDTLSLNCTQHELLKYYNRELAKSIKGKILDVKYNIYFENQKVLVPNKYYCHGFFELTNIYDSKLLLDEISTWIATNLQIEKPDCIIAIGDNARKILDIIFDKYKQQNIQINAKKYYVNTSNIYLSTYHFQNQIDKDSSIVLLTDVIGSANILSTSLYELNKKNIKKILTIVNATPKKSLFVNNISYSIKSIVEKHVIYHPSMPRNWDYSEIKTFDLENFRLIENSSLPEGPIWIKLSNKKVRDIQGQFDIIINPFIEDLYTIPKSYYCGHFESRSNHLGYLFNISSIINAYSRQISECIANYLNDIESKIDCEQSKENRTCLFSYLIFPDFNPGLDKVAEAIAKRMPNLLVLPVGANDLDNGLPEKFNFTNGSIIVLDDAFVTGTTIERMIDIASERNAKNVFSFVLLKRGNAYQARKFEKWNQYGETTVHSRYLVDAEIPIYNSENCPICKKKQEYKKLRTLLGDDKTLKGLNEYIDKIIYLHETQQVREFVAEREKFPDQSDSNTNFSQNEETNLDRDYFTRLNLRWKLQSALAVKSVNMRKNIVEMLKRKNDYRSAILLIIQILSEEKYYFIYNKQNFEILFYKQFVTTLKASCRDLLNNIASLKDNELIAIFDIVIIFDESYFLEIVPQLMTENKNEEKLLFAIIVSLFLSRVSEESPLRVLAKLETIEKNENNSLLFKLLPHLTEHLSQRHKLKSANSDIALQIFNKIEVKNHDINHRIEAVFDCNGNINLDDFKSNYQYFKDDFLCFLKDIKKLLSNLQSKDLYNKLYTLMHKLEISSNEIEKIIANGVDDINSSTLKSYFGHITNHLCDDLDPNNLRKVLNSFKADIKEICFKTLEQEKEKLNTKEINYKFIFPDEPCVIFGEEKEVVLIFKNLIENIHTHSNGSICYIYAFINRDDNRINILFIDNGNSTDPIPSGKGILSVERSVSACQGAFAVSRIDMSQHQEAILKQFDFIETGTVADVQLSLFTNI